MQQKRKLRIFISNTFNPAKPDAEDGEGTVASWELRVEGRLLEDVSCISKWIEFASEMQTTEMLRFNVSAELEKKSYYTE